MKVAINGFGRIGRQTLRIMMEKESDLEVVAINDLTDNATLAHLFEFDSTYGPFKGTIETEDGFMTVNGKRIKLFSEPDPTKLPWADLEVDIVLECTGFFRTHEGASKHIEAGAKRVIVSAPCKGEKGADVNIVMGVNEETFDPENHKIISNASCTTNCLAPVAKVLHENFTIKRGFMTTIHAVTNDQKVLDLPHPDLRRARSCIQSMIPTTTGAAKAVGQVLPELKGKLDGISVRVPTPTTSLVDLTVEVEKETTAEEVNAAFKKRASEIPTIFAVEPRPLVSKDFQGDSHSSTVDAANTKVMNATFIKVLSWYDNEWGYSARLVDLAQYIGQK